MAHIVVLGGGQVGRVMALDLARDEDLRVTVVDRDTTALERVASAGLATRRADLSDRGAVAAALAHAAGVVGDIEKTPKK
jgi:saccharopine dehydrogenase-like NADP-dependent oxidoreductase